MTARGPQSQSFRVTAFWPGFYQKDDICRDRSHRRRVKMAGLPRGPSRCGLIYPHNSSVRPTHPDGENDIVAAGGSVILSENIRKFSAITC
jgi:hypothetical protein